MATSGRIPSLGFGVSIGAVVLLGFGSWTFGSAHVVSARAYAENVQSARAFTVTHVVSASCHADNSVRARGFAQNVVSARAYLSNVVTAIAIMELPDDASNE